ncbi:MAG: ubiquinone biosynthesis regulatory protein kinase UbiB [Legionellales bacterium]|nr:ubiquinone biosynthesis regulatory protein kinase UbiB [Legionellales bacterium]
MKRILRVWRLGQINYVMAKHGLDHVFVSLGWLNLFRWVVYLNPWNWSRPTEFNRGMAIRHMLQELGPVYVKFGQALSTRRDLLPADIANELTLLQDKVSPFPTQKARQIVEQSLGRPLTQLFAEFNDQPLASASIAQVHAARLKTGQQVVVKILRPNMHKIIEQDVSLMYALAHLIETYWPDGERLHPIEVVAEFEKTIFDELDLLREAGNASQLKRNFADYDYLHIPEVYWQYTRRSVMVMERIYGTPVNDVTALRLQGVDLKQLAELGVEIFFTQVFRDSVFHADMHPGNIFVDASQPQSPRYISVDFGILGSLSQEDKQYLAANLLAFFNRDYRQVAQLHVESGWVTQDTRVDEFEASIRAVCEPIFERPLKEISFAQVVMQLFQTGRRFNMEVQPQLVLLQKTLFAVEGLGRTLYPDLDLWRTAKPFLEQWVSRQIGPLAILHKLEKEAPKWVNQWPEFPALGFEVLELIKRNQLRQLAQEKRQQRHLPDNKQRRGKKIGIGYGIGASLLGFSLAVGWDAALVASSLWAEHSLTLGLAGLLVLWVTWMTDTPRDK